MLHLLDGHIAVDAASLEVAQVGLAGVAGVGGEFPGQPPQVARSEVSRGTIWAVSLADWVTPAATITWEAASTANWAL